MNNCKIVATLVATNEKMQKEDGSQVADASRYKSLIGSLIYITATRPDIMYATNLLSKFMQNPSMVYLEQQREYYGTYEVLKNMAYV